MGPRSILDRIDELDEDLAALDELCDLLVGEIATDDDVDEDLVDEDA